MAPTPVEGKKTGDSAAPPRGTAGSRFSRFPTHLPLFLMNIHLAGAHGAYTSVRCRGASEPAHHPGRTWGVHQGTLLLCFCGHPGAHGAYYRVRCCCAPAVSGFKSQPKRGPPKKGKQKEKERRRGTKGGGVEVIFQVGVISKQGAKKWPSN